MEGTWPPKKVHNRTSSLNEKQDTSPPPQSWIEIKVLFFFFLYKVHVHTIISDMIHALRMCNRYMYVQFMYIP